MITDITLFKGLLQINDAKLQVYSEDIIEQKEPELLRQWFGYALAKDILAATPSTEAQELIDGKEYTDTNGDLQLLTGLKTYLPYYMYFYVLRDQQSITTTLGQQSALAENSAKTDITDKIVKNYNKGVIFANDMIDYIEDNEDVYTTAILCYRLQPINIYGI